MLPIILASDQTHLTNFSGDKKLWPVYLTLGNIHSRIRNKPSAHAWIPIALLPIFPKRVDKIPGYSEASQEKECSQLLHNILWNILEPLTDYERPQRVEDGLRLNCCDMQIRFCFPILCSWLADHMETANIQGMLVNRCPICPCEPDQLGDFHPGKILEQRNHRQYKRLYAHADVVNLRADGMKSVNNALWHLQSIHPPDLVRPDILHGIYLGMLTHLMGWLTEFLSDIGRLVIFDDIWQSLPPYPGFTPPTKSYRQVTQWTGKEMRNLGRCILGAFAATIRRTTDNCKLSAAQTIDANKAIRAVRYLTDFHLLAQYRSHTPETIAYMETYLANFHESKYVFLKYRAGKVQSQKARAAVSEQLSANRREMSAAKEAGKSKTQLDKLSKDCRLELELLKSDILEDGSHWNFPKMHMLCHYGEQISKYGQLIQYSTEVSEVYHKPLKDAYRWSNHVNPTPQILSAYERDHAFAMREANMLCWSKSIGSKRDQHATGLGESGSVVPRFFLRLQGRQDLTSVRQLGVDYGIPDLEHTVLEYFRENHFTYDTPGNPSADCLTILAATCEPFFSLQLTLPSFQDDETVHHICRATGKRQWRGKRPRADWVWLNRSLNSRNSTYTPGGLNGRIPARLNCIFKVKIPGGDQIYRLVHVTLTSLVGPKTMSNEEGMIKVGLTEWAKNVVVRASDIGGMVHLIPIEKDRLWLVNNRIDLHTWNLLYDQNF